MLAVCAGAVVELGGFGVDGVVGWDVGDAGFEVLEVVCWVDGSGPSRRLEGNGRRRAWVKIAVWDGRSGAVVAVAVGIAC